MDKIIVAIDFIGTETLLTHKQLFSFARIYVDFEGFCLESKYVCIIERNADGSFPDWVVRSNHIASI